MQRGFLAMKWQSTITKKTWDERAIICHKSTSDGNVLAMMCGRDEEPQPSVVAQWKIIMACAHYMAMDTQCLE
jgi:hypothetical protein